jgi:putative ABC transport system substrate-binding protein
MRTKIAFFITAFAILVSALSVHAQQAVKMHRIGVLQVGASAWAATAFYKGLRDLDYVEGRNIVIERRFADGNRDRLARQAAELVRLNVDVIVCVGAAVQAVIRATRTIPIVVAVAGDFVARGWARSLRRPGGNVTGLSTLALGLMGKQLELLKETVPSLSRVGIVHSPDNRGHANLIRQAKEAAPVLGLGLIAIPVEGAADLPAAVRRMKAEGIDGIVVLRSGFLLRLRGQITTLSRAARLPSLFGHGREAAAGGLMAYGADTRTLFRGAAAYVDKILKGAKPAVLPISQARKFNLTVNLKTARALGITFPRSIMVRANKVIE